MITIAQRELKKKYMALFDSLNSGNNYQPIKVNIIEVKTGFYSKKAFAAFNVALDKEVVKRYSTNARHYSLYKICQFDTPSNGSVYVNEDGEICISLMKSSETKQVTLDSVQHFLFDVLLYSRQVAASVMDDKIWKTVDRLLKYTQHCINSEKIVNDDFSDLIGMPMNPFELEILKPLTEEFFSNAMLDNDEFKELIEREHFSGKSSKSKQADAYIQIFRMLN